MPARPAREGCEFSGCDRKHYAKGYCNAHWRQWRRGVELHPIGPQRNTGVRPTGYRRMKQGYVVMAHDGGWGYEHRIVMERILGRPLAPGESVHHVNGDRTDNRPENLELWVTDQPCGQRVVDLVEWARSILARYAAEESILQRARQPAT